MTKRALLCSAAVIALGAGLVAPVPAVAVPLDFVTPRAAAKTLAANFSHAAFLDANGGVWASGFQKDGALGDGVAAESSVDDPVAAPLPAGVSGTKVDVGGDVTVVLGDNGVVYGAGRNDAGQLTGTGAKSTLTAFTWSPSVVAPPAIVDVATADSSGVGGHTIALGADGLLYETGARDGGPAAATALQLFSPSLPAGAGTPTSVVAGTGDVLVVTDTGRLYGIGSNITSRLGGDWVDATTWVRLDTTAGVVAAVAGYGHTSWLTSTGALYGVGSDAHGQLGNGDPKAASSTPVQAPGVWTGIAGEGGDSTTALTSAGAVYVLGRQPDFSDATSPALVAGSAGLVVSEIGAGATTQLMRTVDGKVYGAGQQNFAQLGSGSNPITSWRVQDDQPTVATASILPAGPVQVGRTLTAGAGSWVPAPATTTYEWRYGTGPGSVVAGTSQDFTPLPADLGKDLHLLVNVSGADLVPSSRQADVGTVLPGAFTGGGNPVVAGTNGVGKKLTASVAATVPASATTWQWYRDNAAIAGATGPAYTQVRADAGRQLVVRTTRALTGYVSVTTGSVARRVPAFSTSRPTITGKARKGSRLVASKGGWSAYGHTFTVRWYRNGKLIAGATRYGYVVTKKDKGRTLTVRVTAKRAGWPAVVVVSAGKRIAR
ncbi:hypothetical protein EFK50_18855 [Nocardioides marmoriginsengisoli]|uniref:Uncharacterized protein n=1 Tax=Nocardioides marmoriginsengisoli TaxID=661483 RepID=A0A3N0CAA8_9ACTN|nr:hypothetical protein [Nocardioides marmoriginsengisoli]RNL60398.1 hypothetical protein EFK50_18855 [Nocardioides marmoriginsengisoli]